MFFFLLSPDKRVSLVRGNLQSFVVQIRAVTSNRVILEKAHYNLNEIDVTFISFVLERLFHSVSQAEQNLSPQNEVFLKTRVRYLLQKRVQVFT